MIACLLAPVPVEHIESALVAHANAGRVAFATGDAASDYSGSSTWQLFTELEQEDQFGNLPVFIHASLSGQQPDHSRYCGQVVSLTGTLAGYEISVAGKHKRPEERPKTALATDTGKSVGFWLVENLVVLDKAQTIALNKFRTHRAGAPGAAISGILRGPIRAFATV